MKSPTQHCRENAGHSDQSLSAIIHRGYLHFFRPRLGGKNPPPVSCDIIEDVDALARWAASFHTQDQAPLITLKANFREVGRASDFR